MSVFIDFGVLMILYVMKCYKKWKSQGKDSLFIKTMMYVYLSFVLYFTLMPIVTSLPATFNQNVFHHHYKSMNLVPFIDVLHSRKDYIRQIVLNVVMTIPFGFLLPFVKKEYAKFTKVVFYTFLFSLGIEVLQPLISASRLSDITDIITNVIGGMIGYMVYLVSKPFMLRLLEKIRIM